MNERPDNDDPRDAHLLAALRHAPDRDAVPPREVSARILAAAHAAVRPARAAPPPWWQRVSAWLMRPQVAASFGTLAVASLVGVMWSTREPPVVEFAPPQAAAERVPPPAAEPSVSTSAVTVQDAAPSEPAHDLLAQTRPSTPAPKKEAAPARANEAKVRAESRERAEVLAEKPASQFADKEAPPPAAAAPAPKAADASVAGSAAEGRSNVLADTQRAARRDTLSSGSAPAALSLARRADSAAEALAQVDALLGAGSTGNWSIGGRAVPHAAQQAAWWAQLRRETASSTWQRISPPPERASPPWLTLVTQGGVHASIDLAGDAVLFCPVDHSACWRAPITAAQREAWMAEAARW